MEEHLEPSDSDIHDEPMLQLFRWKHLQHESMKAISRQFCQLAMRLTSMLPKNPERTSMLRKLREAKDCAVTALLWKDPAA